MNVLRKSLSLRREGLRGWGVRTERAREREERPAPMIAMESMDAILVTSGGSRAQSKVESVSSFV